MSLQRPLEGLLRPPLEWYTTLVSALSSGLLIIFPEWFVLPPAWAYPVASLFAILGLLRFRQGYRVTRYQCRLRQMPRYGLTPQNIPAPPNALFLGKGFLWTSQHTQRLRDLDLPYNLPYKNPSRLQCWLQAQRLKWNFFQAPPAIGGQPCLHGISEVEEDMSIPLADRASHLLVVGLPGMGKTRLAEILISQDIRRGDVVIVIDPKGDADLLKRVCAEAEAAGREHEVLIFHLGFPQLSCRYNPIGNFTRVTEVANRISNQLPSSGDSAAFKEFGWQFINSMALALVSMGEQPGLPKNEILHHPNGRVVREVFKFLVTHPGCSIRVVDSNLYSRT